MLKKYGIRLDSGDLAYLSKEARKIAGRRRIPGRNHRCLQRPGRVPAPRSWTSGREDRLLGVGTNLITSKDCPSFGGVYKLAATMDKDGNFIPKIKISENTEKITNPGNKTIYRIYDKATGKIKADLICFVGETYDTDKDLLLFDPIETWKKTKLPGGSYTMREILVPVFRNGECGLPVSFCERDRRILPAGERTPCGMRPSGSSIPMKYMWTSPNPSMT